MRRITCGIVGLGGAGQGWLRQALARQDLEVTAVADVDEALAQRIADEHGIGLATSNWRELVRSERVEWVFIVLPHSLHLPVSVEAFEAGKHVLLEKPTAMNLAEAQKILAAAEKNRRRLFVCHGFVFEASVRTAAEIIGDGTLGRLFMASINYYGYEVVRLNDENNWKGTWEKAGGGVVLDAGYHVIYTTNKIMGRPCSVSSALSKATVIAPNKAEDNALLLVEYESGALAQITASFTTVYPTSFEAPTLHISYGFFGDKGTLWGNYRSFGEARWELEVFTNEGRTSPVVDQSKRRDMLDHFVDCLAHNKPCEVTSDDILDAQAVADAVYKSYQEGRKIEIEAEPGKRTLK